MEPKRNGEIEQTAVQSTASIKLILKCIYIDSNKPQMVKLIKKKVPEKDIKTD